MKYFLLVTFLLLKLDSLTTGHSYVLNYSYAFRRTYDKIVLW